MAPRVAMLSVHTSPLAQPGAGDGGGMNVYVRETSRQLANRGLSVDIYTRDDGTQPTARFAWLGACVEPSLLRQIVVLRRS